MNPFSMGITVPGVGLRVSVSSFFDRQAIKDALSEMDYRALTKASLRVKDHARRLIKKRGMARLPTKVAKQYAGLPLSRMVSGGAISQRTADRIVREVRNPPSSPPGSPVYTHTPYAGSPQSFLGFRRNLWNFYDSMTASAVVGPSRKGRQLPYLHEFGGTVALQTWVFKPQIPTKSGQMRSPIIWKLGEGTRPSDMSKWAPLSGGRQVVRYPARPFMGPAMLVAIARGDIARAFQGAFRVSYGGRGFSVKRA
jgi:hypothetical protein